MKYLTLVRHAKSSWDDFSQGDHGRTLNERGLRNAPAMGRFLANTYFGMNGTDPVLPAPDRLVASTAKRTVETACLMAGQMHFDFQALIQDSRAYLAESQTLLEIVHNFSDDWRHVMLFAHNNGITDFANRLLARGNIGDMPTCAVALLEFPNSNWSMTNFGQARLVGYITPKLIEKRFPASYLPDPFNGSPDSLSSFKSEP